MRLRRAARPDIEVASGERLLAGATARDGALVGATRDAFYVVVDGVVRRIPWEQVEAATWDSDTDTFRLTEVGSWGEVRHPVEVELDDSRRLLDLVHERVIASVVLQRHVRVDGRRGLRVIARRAPRGDQPIQWVYEYDEGIDPADPDIRTLAEQALATAQADVGTSP